MPERAKWNARLLLVNRLIIDLMSEAYGGLYDKKDFGSKAERTLILAAIVVGQLEDRPMSAMKISQYAGNPRGTVLRRLDELIAAGLVVKTSEKKFIFPMLGMRKPEWVRAMDAIERRIHEASTALSKLDTVAIARRK